MHPIAIDKTIAYGDVKLVVASDPDARTFLGVGFGHSGRGNFVFIEVQQETVDELAAGAVDLFTVIQKRGTGMAFEAPRRSVPTRLPQHAAR